MTAIAVRIVVPARNEARALPALLKSIAVAIATARDRGAIWNVEVVVVTDRCSDDTAAVAVAAGATVIEAPAPGGKVEALRAGLCDGVDVHVFVDADVVVGPATLLDLVTTLLASPTTLATCPPLAVPEKPVSLSPLSWALWRYNRARGFSSERLWLSGRCYAARTVTFPTVAEMSNRCRAAGWPPQPLRADDLWLSRSLLQHGAAAIVHVDTDPVVFRPPATLAGMSRTWRRLRRERRVVDVLFPELKGPGRDRAVDMEGRPFADRLALAIFAIALQLCRLHTALLDRFDADTDPWPVVTESKG